MSHIANAVVHLHDLRIAHNDLKPDNIMGKFVGIDSDGAKLYDLKVGDFGGAREIQNPDDTKVNPFAGSCLMYKFSCNILCMGTQ